jgi:flagellar FliL protein
MAKQKNEAKESEEEVDPGKGGAKNLVMIVVAALLSLGLGAGGAFFYASTQMPPPASDSGQLEAELAEAEAVAAQKRTTEDFRERLYSLEPLIVNVTGDGYNRFLKLRVEFETSSASMKEELDARLPQVRDAMIVLLSGKQLSDITDFEGKALLKEDILERVNDLLETGSVRSILFTEFVVQ